METNSTSGGQADAERQRRVILYTDGRAVRIDAEKARSHPGKKAGGRIDIEPDESDRRRWIATNRSAHPLFVQHPAFNDTAIHRVNPGCAIALVEGSRIAVSPNSAWINVACR